MTAPSTTQSKRRKLFGALAGAVLLPALVALAVPDGSPETEIATIPIAAETEISAAPSSTTTTEAPTTTTEALTTTTAVPTTTTAVPATTTPPTTVPKTQAATYVAPTTTTTAAPVYVPPPPPAPAPPVGDQSEWAFLACVKQRESGGNYSIVSSNGLWHGAYQFAISSWNATAQHAGRPDLVGVLPSQASPADQDAMALALYRWQGKAPWGGYC